MIHSSIPILCSCYLSMLCIHQRKTSKQEPFLSAVGLSPGKRLSREHGNVEDDLPVLLVVAQRELYWCNTGLVAYCLGFIRATLKYSYVNTTNSFLSQKLAMSSLGFKKHQK